LAITVYTSGVFDLFHAGHLQALEWARKQGDILIVGVLSDEDSRSYKRLPVIPYDQRSSIVQSLAIVDDAIAGPKFETEEFYRALSIDVHCQGDEIEGFYTVANRLGILRILGRSSITESTEIIRRVIDRRGELDHC